MDLPRMRCENSRHVIIPLDTAIKVCIYYNNCYYIVPLFLQCLSKAEAKNS
jgi:hypothetical protein